MWKILESEKILTNKYYNVRKEKCQTPTGAIIKEYYLKEDNPVVIIVIENKGKLTIARHYRHGAKKRTFCFPAGTTDNNEEPLSAAKRELQEELGIINISLTMVGEIFCDPSSSEQKVVVFHGKNPTYDESKKSLEAAEEDLEKIELDIKEIENKIRKSEFDCAICMAVYLLVKQKGLLGS